MVIATVLIGAVVNGIGIWYGANAGKDEKSGTAYTEQDKKAYYDSRISDSEKVKSIQAELDRLKSKQQ